MWGLVVRMWVVGLMAALVAALASVGGAQAAGPPPAFTSSPGQGPSFDGYAPGLPDSGPLGLRWRRDLRGTAVAGPESVYVLNGGLELSAVSWQTGLTRWSRVRKGDGLDTEYGLPEALATDGSVVVVVSGNELYARDADTGAFRWSASVPELSATDWTARIHTPRVAVTAGVVVVQVLGGVQAFDLTDGDRLWAQDERGEATFAVDGETVGIGNDDYYNCHLRAIDLRTGAQRWITDDYADGACFSADLSAHDGTITWVDTRRTSDGSFVRPRIASLSFWPIAGDGRIFYGAYTDDGGIGVVGATEAGDVLWRGPEEPMRAEHTVPSAVGPHSVLTTRRDEADPTGRTFAMQLVEPATGSPIGPPLISEAGAYRESVVVGDGVVLAGGSVVEPGGSPVSFPGLRVVVAGSADQYEVPGDEFDTYVRDPRPAVPFRLPQGTTSAECRVDGSAWEACRSPWKTPDLGADGEHAVEVRHTSSAPAARLVVVLDREAPSLAVTGGVSGTVGASEQPFPSFRLSSDDPLASFECAVDDEAWSSYCGAVYGVSADEGPHVLRFRARDRNGNRSVVEERRWTVDLRSPTVRIDTMPRPVRTTAVEVPFTVSADAVAVRCVMYEWLGNHEEVVAPSAPCAGAWRGTLHERPDGSSSLYRLLVVAADRYGNETFEERGFNVDIPQRGYRRAGTGEVLARTTSDSRLVGQVEITADEDVRKTAQCRLSGVAVWRSCRVYAPLDSAQAYVDLPVAPVDGSGFAVPRADGPHEVLVRGVDMWGDPSDPLTVTVAVDATAPTVDGSGFPSAGRPAGDVSFPLPVADGPGGSGLQEIFCTVAPSGDPFHDRAVGCDGATFRARLDAGSYVVVVRATDQAGNVTRLERRLEVLPAPEPGVGAGISTTTIITTTTATTPPAAPAATTTTASPSATGTIPVGPARPGAQSPDATVPAAPAPMRPVPCRASHASGGRAPRVTALVRRNGRIVVRAEIPGTSVRRRGRVEVQARTGCGPWRVVRRGTARGAVRLTSERVPATVDAVRVRARVDGRLAVSASRLVP